MFDGNTKEIKRLSERVDAINALEPQMEALTDDELKGLTSKFKERFNNGETLDDLLHEAFAAVREAGRRTIGQRHYDVQLIGGMVLHEGRIAEMKTGEGKTLAATLPVYLNAIAGRGVHVITVNDYLAARDAEWMGSIYRFLGMTVGTIVHGLDFSERQQAYAADITYGTNNEFGFDYLRDNMVTHGSQLVQRELYYCIVDEVDSILIDEARTPLIISGAVEQDTSIYYEFAKLAARLKPEEDYTVDEKARTISLTEEGIERVESMLQIDNLYDEVNFEKSHYINQAIKAKALFERDRDYVVKDGEVIIVDEFTGRLMIGRRYSDGLHQSIEAKENVKIERESQTLATITFQNYFRMYEKLAGMTGTAKTEESEFLKIYGMDVVVIPTNLDLIRIDQPDLVYKTTEAKYNAIVDEIARAHETGRPVLVGTISIERSEFIHRMLKKRGVPHQVLNAKFHEKEAEIVAQAGRWGAVTIATNMAGRGTDILLGGNPEFLARQKLREELGENPNGADEERYEARYQELLEEFKKQTEAERQRVLDVGGLYIIGTERHESRRIDNQLRGRAGRQGDPGESRFFVSLEDDLMRLFGSERIASIMNRLGWEDDQPIEHNQISKSIENAQRKVENHFFEMRKQVLEYDDVMNRQREVIYSLRQRVLKGDDMKDRITEMIGRLIDGLMDQYCDEKTYEEEWDLEGLVRQIEDVTAGQSQLTVDMLTEKNREEVREIVDAEVLQAYGRREEEIGEDRLREIERMIMLQAIDQRWIDHLRGMDDLREGIGLRAYGQRNPLIEYQFEGFQMFQEMVREVEEAVIKHLYRVRVVTDQEAQEEQRREESARRIRQLTTNRAEDGQTRTVQQRRVRQEDKVGRNDPCPCGSGKKYKRCHGR